MTYVTHSSAAHRSSQRRRGLWQTLRTFVALHTQRRALSRLDSDMLADIGVTREEAEIEASRPMWDVPANWRQ